MKTLNVYNNIWQYKVGRKTITLFDPENKKYFIDNETLFSSFNWITEESIICYIKTDILKKEWEINGMKICSVCNLKDSSVILQVNPYAAEINGDNKKHLLCYNCCCDLQEEI